ncbi:efflux RND transporter permease subunit [Alkalibacillus haloalkaliphilus]|uniref:efflux RND transporter permease subunit n=1 Tax=Alkalibacillus haloalkaliphilus TaxID=94136 RepID=UPI002935CDF0|nr:efflux RND transporter permease subunit [Alkalibacillus haloalkaliphilus]MDV2580902.1 efflux RND transporter permease subunit [Alkalibacillus haloalkaliphilus]
MKFLLKRYKMVFLLFTLLLIIGGYTFYDLPQRDFPETPMNQATITTPYPGASPEDVEREVTSTIENEIHQINGIESYESTSSRGVSNIILSLDDSENHQEIMTEVNQTINQLQSNLPDDALDTNVSLSEVTTPSQSYFLTADHPNDLEQLHELKDTWTNQIEQINGVSHVEFNGLEEQEIIINFDSDTIQDYQIQFTNILTALEDEWNPNPLGEQTTNDGYRTLTINHINDLDEIEDTRIPTGDQGSVNLSELAEITVTSTQQPDLITYEGDPAINITVFLQSREDIPSNSQLVDEEVQSLMTQLPEGIHLHHYFAQDEFIANVFDDLFLSLAIAVLAVILVTTLGLTFMGSIVVAIAIPTSLILGLIPLPLLGTDLNQISVIGAIIALGILVDDSIVLNDNIERRYRLGDQALSGTVKGIKEVRNSIITSTLAIVFTFSPLIFLSGANGAFIRALPSVLISTLIASTIVALILVPAIRYFHYQKSSKKIKANPGILGKWLSKGARFYANRIIRKLIRVPKRTVAIGLLMTTSLFLLILWTPFEFFPSADREEVTIDVTLPNGLTKADTLTTLQSIEEDLLNDQQDEIKDISLFTSGSAPALFGQPQSNTGEHTGRMYVRINQDETNAESFIDQWENQLRDDYEEAEIFLETIQQGPPTGAPLTVTVSGEELSNMLDIRDEVIERLDDAGAELVVDNVGDLTPNLTYEPNREEMENYNVTVQTISEQINLRTTGIPFAQINSGLDQYNVQLYLDRLEEYESLNLEEIVIPVDSQEGPPIASLDEFVDVEENEVIPRIHHEDGERTVTIRAYADQTDEIEDTITPYIAGFNDTHDQYALTVGAETDNQDTFFAEITVIFSVVVLLVYLLIAFQFNSLTMPFLILISVYLAIAGAILGLFVTQTPISFLAITGMVSLTGIVVRNSIVLVDFIEQSIKSNSTINEAVVKSAEARFRPIVLTTITSIIALTPVAISGDVLFQPLAITIISGIAFSTVLTLLLVPVLYVLFKRA